MTATSRAADPRPSSRARLLGLLPAVLPGALVGLGGLFHPVFLTPATAEQWRLVHLVLLPLFPLVGGALWWVLRGVRSPAAQAARALAALYALLYTALDAIAGVGAPHQVLGTVRRGEPLPPTGDLYEIGDRVGHAGVLLLLVAGVLAALALQAHGSAALSGAGAVVLALGALLHLQHHVFAPYGVLGMLLVAVGTGGLELSRTPRSVR